MKALSMEPTRLTRAAIGICVAVVLLRVLFALTTPAPALVEDAAGYHLAAQRLVEHGYYAYVHPEVPVENPAPNAQVLPGYPVFLAILYALFGSEPQPLVSIAQAFVSGLTMWGVFLLGRRAAGERAAFMATLAMAVYPPFWWSYRYVLTEDVFTALTVWTALALVSASDEPGRVVRWIAVGAFAAASTFVRVVGGVWVVSAGLIMVMMSPEARSKIVRGGAVAAVAAVAVMAPWWLRNARIYDAFVPLNTKFAGTELTHLVEDRAELERLIAPFAPSYVDAKADFERQAGLGALTAERRTQAMRDNATGYVFGRLRATAISIVTYHPNPFMNFRGWGAVTEVLHLAMLVLAAVGAWRIRRSTDTWVMLTLPFVVIVLHTPTLIFSRYLYPAMPFMMVFAGVALALLMLEREVLVAQIAQHRSERQRQ